MEGYKNRVGIIEVVSKVDIEVSQEAYNYGRVVVGAKELGESRVVMYLKSLGYNYLVKRDGVYELRKGILYNMGDETTIEYELMSSGELRYISSFNKESRKWLTSKVGHELEYGVINEMVIINVINERVKEGYLITLKVN